MKAGKIRVVIALTEHRNGIFTWKNIPIADATMAVLLRLEALQRDDMVQFIEELPELYPVHSKLNHNEAQSQFKETVQRMFVDSMLATAIQMIMEMRSNREPRANEKASSQSAAKWLLEKCAVWTEVDRVKLEEQFEARYPEVMLATKRKVSFDLSKNKVTFFAKADSSWGDEKPHRGEFGAGYTKTINPFDAGVKYYRGIEEPCTL